METTRKIQSKNTDLFLAIANADKLIYKSATELTVFVMGYYDLLEAFREKMLFLGDEAIQKRRQDTVVMLNSADQKQVEYVKKVFIKVRGKLRKQLDAVSKAGQDGGAVPSLITTNTGEQRIYVDVKNDTFQSVLVPSMISSGLEVDTELKLLNIVMETILVEYKKKPSKLKVCKRHGCSNLFFKFSEKSKYCSTKCSNCSSQESFRARKKSQ